MSYLINNQQKLNDILFVNRNKNYGAYAIRSAYGETILKSLLLTGFLFTTLMSLAFYYSNKNNEPKENNNQLILNDSTRITIFELKPEEPLKTETKANIKPKSFSNLNTTGNTTIKITDSISIKTNSTLITEIKSSTSTNNNNNIGSYDSSAANGTNESKFSSQTNTSVKELIYVDSQPEFEGGLKALGSFLANNLKYPNSAFEARQEGTVYVKFVVDEKGKVGNLKLLNNLDQSLNDEALRVVGLIPDFKQPAKVNGLAVKVYYQIPIKFKLAK